MTQTYNAVIFDMDGVIADSEPVYAAAMNVVLESLGHHVDPELQRRLMGHSVEATWLAIREEFKIEGDTKELVATYDLELCRLLALVEQPLPGVLELLKELRARGVPVGLASSSWPGWIEALVGATGLGPYFDTIVSAKYVDHGKPAPDVYLLAASNLGIEPAHCIAIEDTPTGLAAAKAAGMLAIQVMAASTAFPPQDVADIVLETLESFDLSLLAGS